MSKKTPTLAEITLPPKEPDPVIEPAFILVAVPDYTHNDRASYNTFNPKEVMIKTDRVGRQMVILTAAVKELQDLWLKGHR